MAGSMRLLWMMSLSLWVCCSHSDILADKTFCIPVLGFGIVQDTNNFVERLITHIDHCVENFVLVLPKMYVTDAGCNESNCTGLYKEKVLSWANRAFIRNVTFIDIHHSLIGVAETWNHILTAFNAPWYAICAYDIAFRPGQLREFSRRFWLESGVSFEKEKRAINFAHTRWENLPGNRGFNFFAMTREVLLNVGLFDENIFPAFWEDRDYQRRLSLWPGACIRTFRNIQLWHGVNMKEEEWRRNLKSTVNSRRERNIDRNFYDYIGRTNAQTRYLAEGYRRRKFNYTSGTVYLGSAWLRTMLVASKQNMDYLMRKWSCNPTLSERAHHLVHCRYIYPFDNPSFGLHYWDLNETSVQVIRDLYSRMTVQIVGSEEDKHIELQTPAFGKNFVEDINSTKPPKRKKLKYSSQEVRQFHYNRRKKVIMSLSRKKKSPVER